VTIFKILAPNGPLNAVVPIDPFGFVEVDLPQVGPLQGMVTFKSYA
jgi:hypothetical protein